MKLKLLVLLITVLLPFLDFAQGASITIFSEDGGKFLLFLNHVQQNKEPHAKMRVDGLTQPNYDVNVVFEGSGKGHTEKDIAVNDAATNIPADVTYKIIKDKHGDVELQFLMAQPAQPNYIPTPEVYVVHYGQDDQGAGGAPVPTQTQPDPNGGSISIGFGTGGGGGGVNIQEQEPGNGTTQIGTTSLSGNTDNDEQPLPPKCQTPMSAGSFKSAKETVANAAFEETKLSAAKSILVANCLNTEQVIQICKLFGFEQAKLDFAKTAYPKTTDPANYSKVSNILSFSSSKTNLNNFIKGGGR